MEQRVLLLDLLPEPGSDLGGLLTQSGFAVERASSIDGASHLLNRRAFALLLVCIGNDPGSVLEESLAIPVEVPRVVVTPARDESLAVRALEAGADGALSLPLSRRELAARLQALVLSQGRDYHRRAPRQRSYRVGELVIDPETHVVRRNGVSIALTPKEFRLLLGLASRAGQVVPHELLLAEVWGNSHPGHAEILRLYIRYLRQKIEDDHRAPRLLINHRGVGYRLVAGVEPEAANGTAPTVNDDSRLAS